MEYVYVDLWRFCRACVDSIKYSEVPWCVMQEHMIKYLEMENTCMEGCLNVAEDLWSFVEWNATGASVCGVNMQELNVLQCRLKGSKRWEVHMSTFWSYSALFGFGGRLCCILVSSPPIFIVGGSFTMYYSVAWRAWKEEGCMCPCSRYISHYLGWLCCTLVSSPPFFIIKGLFTMYSNVVWRGQRDESFACPHSRAIPHYLVLGGLCCISVSSPPFFIIEGSFSMYSSVVWRTWRDEWCALPCSAFSGFGGGRLCCISVSSPPFFIVKGSFTMYYSVVWRALGGQMCACLHFRDIPHYLVLGGLLCLKPIPSYFLLS